jgi:FAD/FMN-containing dehydrogenase
LLVLQAIRGAAASFGIVTEFVFQTHPAPPSTVQYSYTFVYASSLSAVHITDSWLVRFYRIGDYDALAQTFSKWQNIISQPNLDRKLSSTLTVTPVGIIISGIALSFSNTPRTCY